MYVYVYICIYIYTGLEIGGVALQNTNHFWGNYESLWQSESQNCDSLIADLRISFHMVSQETLFLVLTTFLDKISSFLDIFYVYGAKIRLHCE